MTPQPSFAIHAHCHILSIATPKPPPYPSQFKPRSSIINTHLNRPFSHKSMPICGKFGAVPLPVGVLVCRRRRRSRRRCSCCSCINKSNPAHSAARLPRYVSSHHAAASLSSSNPCTLRRCSRSSRQPPPQPPHLLNSRVGPHTPPPHSPHSPHSSKPKSLKNEFSHRSLCEPHTHAAADITLAAVDSDGKISHSTPKPQP